LNDKKEEIPNEIIILDINKPYKLSDSISVELISITHSIPNATIILIHTPEGKIAYTNDFKFDDSPVMGKPTDYNTLKEIKPKILFLDSLYSDKDRKTPSEKNAKKMLNELLLNLEAKDNAIIITTFSSHIARLKTIIELGEKLNRKVVLLGRSLAKYVYAAEDIGIIDFSKKAKIISYKSQIARYLKKIQKEGKKNYLIIATGHQGEKDAVLSEIANDKFKFKLEKDDVVVFSCNTIPSELNIENRRILEENLSEKGVRIFKDVHESGHASRQDHKEMIELLKPKHIIPSHVNKEKALYLVSLAEELGYKNGKDVHVLEDGNVLEIK
ncbi:MAG: MBL fold metallo-hydrolase RNA specificity domain-containing protein, partial [Candidatus Woesearchaeota archaeon]